MSPTTGSVSRRWVMGGIVLSCLFLLVASVELTGQELLTSGARVRFDTASIYTNRWTTGDYLGLDDRVLRMVSTAGDTLSVPRPAIHEFEVSEGRYAHPVRGIVAGAGAGLLTGFIVRNVVCSRHDDPLMGGNPPQEQCANTSALTASALGGGVLGGLIGRLAKTDRWLRMTVERSPR